MMTEEDDDEFDFFGAHSFRTDVDEMMRLSE